MFVVLISLNELDWISTLSYFVPGIIACVMEFAILNAANTSSTSIGAIVSIEHLEPHSFFTTRSWRDCLTISHFRKGGEEFFSHTF